MRSAFPVAVLSVLALVVAGCASGPGATPTSTGPASGAATTSQGAGATGGTGGLVLRVTGAADTLGEFTALIVGVSSIRLVGEGVGGTYPPSTEFVDLVQHADGSSETLFAGAVQPGVYQRVELEVATAVGTLSASGDVVNVTLPGGRLSLTKGFTVAADEDTTFTLDVQAQALDGGGYQLQPHAAGSFIGDGPGGGPANPPPATTRTTTSRAATTSRTTTSATSSSTSSSSTTTAPPAPAQPKLSLWVEAAGNASALRHLNVTLSAVLVKGPSGNVTYAPAAAKLDLARLANGTVALAWNRTLAPGNYTHFELRVASVAAVGANRTLNATVAGGKLALPETVRLVPGNSTHLLMSIQVQQATATTYTLKVDPIASGVIPKPVNNRRV